MWEALTFIGETPREYAKCVRLYWRRHVRMRRIFCFSIFLHCLVIYGGIDLHLISPMQDDLPQYNSTNIPPANRLVLIIADGLRDERLTTLGSQNITPHLMDIKLRRGAAGVARAKIPTESHPGHISLLAGTYEDTFAITFRRWLQDKLVFDTVINQSSWVFGWGSPDMSDFFNKKQYEHVYYWSYPREMQAFEEPSIELDHWVLDNVENMFDVMFDEGCGGYCTRKHMHPMELRLREMFDFIIVKEGCKRFCGDKTIFVIHLLGMTGAGHVYKPHSERYVENLRYVDEVVKRVEDRFMNFIDDDKTTFILTSTYGMTNWGSHGSGSEHETHVPVLAWGAGIKPGQKRMIKLHDLTPLMSALIGIKIPTNSLGRLPMDYLNVNKSIEAEMTLNNAKQYAALFKKLEQSRKHVIGITPFSYFSKNGSLEEELDEVQQQIDAKDYENATRDAKFLLNVLEQGIKYYLNYYKHFMVRCLAAAVFMWFIYLSSTSTRNYGDDMLIRLMPEPTYVPTIKNIPILDLMVYVLGAFLLPYVISVAYVSNLPCTTYFYVTLPVICAIILAWNYDQTIYAVTCLQPIGFSRWILQLTLYAGALLALVCSFSDRVFFVPILIIMVIWAWCNHYYFTLMDRIRWSVICGLFCIFLVLPSVPVSEQILHGIGIGVWVMIMIGLIVFVRKNDALIEMTTIDYTALPGLIVMSLTLLSALLLGFFTRYYMDGLFVEFCIVNLYTVGLALVLPFLTLQIPLFRLILWLLGFMTYYAFVAVSYELLFMVAYTALLAQWVILEDKIAFLGYSTFIAALKGDYIHDDVYRRHDIGQQLVRRAFFYVTLLLLGFFGPGNFAELSSFDPMWAKPFVSTFDPFVITILSIFKLSIPIMLCTLVLYGINVVTPGRVGTVFVVVISIFELMIIHFLLNIQSEDSFKNIGSNLNIGTSLSKFIVSGVLTLIVMFYYQISHYLINFRTI